MEVAMDGLSDGRFKDLCILLEKLKVVVVVAAGGREGGGVYNGFFEISLLPLCFVTNPYNKMWFPFF